MARVFFIRKTGRDCRETDQNNMAEKHTVTLKQPIKLSDDKEITEVVITEPNAAAMKGLTRFDILMMSDDAHKKLLPRISYPQITPNMFNQMSLKDTQKIMGIIVSFFVDTEDEDYLTT